ncbi:hypothetical protein HU200_033073 [Digitaria exilis]|uniref:Uncharacterized protein n=1 Tax=Digitaria exilis TaxID=1010633 RepID=A0A835BSH1_9POAL|nr:hypothetical protein HU200_033073 [Digitaria exilis]
MEALREEVVAAGTPPLPSAQVVSKDETSSRGGSLFEKWRTVYIEVDSFESWLTHDANPLPVAGRCIVGGVPSIPLKMVVHLVKNAHILPPGRSQGVPRKGIGNTCEEPRAPHVIIVFSTPLLSVHLNQIGFRGLDPASMALDWSALARSARDTRHPTPCLCSREAAQHLRQANRVAAVAKKLKEKGEEDRKGNGSAVEHDEQSYGLPVSTAMGRRMETRKVGKGRRKKIMCRPHASYNGGKSVARGREQETGEEGAKVEIRKDGTLGGHGGTLNQGSHNHPLKTGHFTKRKSLLCIGRASLNDSRRHSGHLEWCAPPTLRWHNQVESVSTRGDRIKWDVTLVPSHSAIDFALNEPTALHDTSRKLPGAGN